jgi:hypothetical protein
MKQLKNGHGILKVVLATLLPGYFLLMISVIMLEELILFHVSNPVLYIIPSSLENGIIFGMFGSILIAIGTSIYTAMNDYIKLGLVDDSILMDKPKKITPNKIRNYFPSLKENSEKRSSYGLFFILIGMLLWFPQIYLFPDNIIGNPYILLGSIAFIVFCVETTIQLGYDYMLIWLLKRKLIPQATLDEIRAKIEADNQ